jgi:BirA family transcriptional regulator, biotin operon repressor / biotin---[acetyl-CoA-carboxylase] ligase
MARPAAARSGALLAAGYGVAMQPRPPADRAAQPEGARRPLAAGLVNDAVVRPGGLWAGVEVVAKTGSTNAVLLELAREDAAPEGAVLVAEEQTAGRGRMGRSWVSPPRAALTFSVLLRPGEVPVARLSWLPLLTGVAVAKAVETVTGLRARLKWPNDVLIGDRKLAGILAEQAGGAVVIGIGINVSTAPGELPPAGPGSLRPTSLLIERASAGREPLLIEVLNGLERRYRAFRADPDPERSGLRAEYIGLTETLGRNVRVQLPGGRLLAGPAEDVDADGRLLVRGPSEQVAVAAGDVIHLR